MKETVILQKKYIDLLGLTLCIYPAAVFTTVLFLISSCGLTCGVDHHEVDYCPEYNEEGMRVQENYAHRCSSGVIPCPITYTSDKSKMKEENRQNENGTKIKLSVKSCGRTYLAPS
uniref:Uncharacterized protein n=1 Tax=Magallana gigas TaxID=29159 RepID=K1PSB7_MAGGI